MVSVNIAKVCGLCAGCTFAVKTTENEIRKGKSVTIFKEIVHNKNVNAYLNSIGASCEEDINKLTKNNTIIVRAHGEPPETYKYFKENNIEFVDCTCPNVAKIHDDVKHYSDLGYKIILLGKYKQKMHPEILGTIGWSSSEVFLIEDKFDLEKLRDYHNEKFYLVCQTTFNMAKADDLIVAIEKCVQNNSCTVIINKSLCNAQKAINTSSVELAKNSDIMIVVGGANSSNSLELYNNVKNYCPSIFIEDIYSYKKALMDNNIAIDGNSRIGITAGASTRKEELVELKSLIEKEFVV